MRTRMHSAFNLRKAPTVFMLFTPDRMLLNPYTYGAEAFKTFTLEVARTENSEDSSMFFAHPALTITAEYADKP